MKKILLAFTILLTVEVSAQYKYPFQNPDLPYQERVENLISLLTPVEKVGLMMNKSASVDRLGIPSYNWWSEACHGCASGGVHGLSATHRYGCIIQCTALLRCLFYGIG